ncbi:hypothetical protein BGI37_08615 [Snodgrassella alvi]|jgi:hypothetical protein|nr:hypothetical protein BGI37_08615 [Snodgrassella alvi]
MANAGRFEVLFRSVSECFVFCIQKNRKWPPCIPAIIRKMSDWQVFVKRDIWLRAFYLPGQFQILYKRLILPASGTWPVG